MRTLFTLLLVAGTVTAANAQQPTAPKPGDTIQVSPGVMLIRDLVDPDMANMKRPAPVLDQKPRFNGNLGQFLSTNIKMPKGAKPEGKIMVNFTVDTAGHLGMIEVNGKKPAEKLNPVEKEIVRVIKAMPAWIPGTSKGQKIPVRYSLPINLN